MIPELGYHYGLKPSDVWDMSRRQFSRYQEHLEAMRKSIDNG